jgi:hypothetical protein
LLDSGKTFKTKDLIQEFFDFLEDIGAVPSIKQKGQVTIFRLYYDVFSSLSDNISDRSNFFYFIKAARIFILKAFIVITIERIKFLLEMTVMTKEQELLISGHLYVLTSLFKSRAEHSISVKALVDLAKSGVAVSPEPVVQRLVHNRWLERVVAADALVELAKSVVDVSNVYPEPLVQLLSDDRNEVRTSVVEALAELAEVYSPGAAEVLGDKIC